MTKIRLFASLVLVVLSVSTFAAEKHADLSAATAGGGNGTWTVSTNTFAWTKNYSARVDFSDLSGDLTEWTTLVIESADFTTDGQWRVDIYCNGESDAVWKGTDSNGGKFYSAGTKTITLLEKITAEQLKTVSKIAVNTASNAGSIVIKDVYLKNDAATPFSATCAGFTTISGNNNCYYNTAAKNFSWTGSTANNMQIFEMTAGTLSDYKTLSFTTSDLTGGPYRVMFMEGTTKLAQKSFYSAGDKVIDFTDLANDDQAEMKALDVSKVTAIRFAGQSDAGNVTINPSSIVLTPKATTPTAIDDVKVAAKAVKIIENGQVVILRDGVRYNALGQVVK